MEIKFIGHSSLRAERGRHEGAGRPVPEAEQPGRGDRRGGRADPHRASPTATPTTSPTRSPSASAPAPTASRSSSSPTCSKSRGSRTRQRPQPRRHGRVRLGLGQARPGLAHQHRPRLRRRALQPEPGTVIGAAGGPGDQHRRQDRLPRRRHRLFSDMKLIAERTAGRRRPDPDRRPLHDGPPRRRRRRRVRRRRDGDPDALRHLPADRDRRRGVQGRGRVEDLLEGRGAGAGGEPLV